MSRSHDSCGSPRSSRLFFRTSATTRWRRSRRSRTDAIANFTAETQASITRAIGEANPFLREEYHLVLLDTLVHELNTVRGVLGEPTSLEYVDMQSGQLTVILKFGELSVAIHWLDLPGITRYEMEFALYGPQQRVTLELPVAVPAQRAGHRRDHRG